jgi:O-succinylbenzoic acid--CoA ligase
LRELTIAADGEILVRGPSLCLGIVEADGIRDCRGDDGWYHTGDYGHLSADGCLHVEGRGDRMFISGGENIYPEEIEAALLDLPSVARAFVVGVPDDVYGARPVAVVKGAQAEACHSAALRAQLKSRLPNFKIPDRFLPWPADCPVDGLKVDRPFLQRYVATCLKIEVDTTY